MSQPTSSEEEESAIARYPESLDYFDPVSEYSVPYRELLGRVEKSMCSEEESYIETLQFGKGTRNDDSTGEETQFNNDCACPQETLVSLFAVPIIANAQDRSKKMSISIGDLKTFLYQLQVSPNVLDVIMDGKDLGSKTQYQSGNRSRTETWFSLSAPISQSRDGLSIDAREDTVVWFDCRKEDCEVRFLLLKTPDKLIARVRNLEESSRGRCILAYEVITCLLESVLAEWAGHTHFVGLMNSIMSWQAYESSRPPAQILGHLRQIDDAINNIMRNLNALRSLLALIEFLEVTEWDLYDAISPHHRQAHLQKLQEQKQRTHISISLFDAQKTFLQNVKHSISASPQLQNFSTSVAEELPRITTSLRSSEAAIMTLNNAVTTSATTLTILSCIIMPGLLWNIAQTTYLPLWMLAKRKPYAVSVLLTTAVGAGLLTFRRNVFHGAQTLFKSVLGLFPTRAQTADPEERRGAGTIPNADAGDIGEDDVAARYEAILRRMLSSPETAEESNNNREE